MDVVLLRQQLEERDRREEQLNQQLQELKGVNQYLKNEVKRLISERQEERLLASGFGDSLSGGWQSGLGLGAEICFERLRLEGEMAEERVSHHEQIEELQRKAEEQASTLTKRAATLITGVLPVLGTSPANSGADSNGGGATQGSQQTLHVSSSSPEVQEQVEQLLHGYMSGKLEEDEAVDRLSQLHCRMQLLASPAHAQHAATQNGNVSEQLKQAQLGGSNRRRTVPEEGASDDTDGQQQREAQQQQQQQPSQRRLAGSTSFTAPPAGIHDFTPSFGGYYSQFVLAEPEKLRRLITRASSQNVRAASMAEHATGLPGPEPTTSTKSAAVANSGSSTSAGPDAVQGNGEVSNSSSGSTWGRSWSLGGRLLSFGSSKLSGSGAAKPGAAASLSTAPAPSLPAAAAAGSDEREPGATQHSTSTMLPAAAPAGPPASDAQGAPHAPTPPPAALKSASPVPPAATATHPENADGGDGSGGGSQPTKGAPALHPPATAPALEPAPHAPTPAPAAPLPKPIRAQSPNISLKRSSSNSSSSNTTAKAGKGLAAAGQGAISALRKSMEQEGEEGQGSRVLMDTTPTPDKDEDLWAQAAPLGGPQGGTAVQVFKAA